MATTKKMNVPDIGGLLGQIAEKRNDLPKAPIQSVQPVEDNEESQPAGKTAKVQNQPAADERTRGTGGRPSVKKDNIEYVKLSPRVPKELKKAVERALIDELYRDKDKNVIKTMDEFVALALTRLLESR